MGRPWAGCPPVDPPEVPPPPTPPGAVGEGDEPPTIGGTDGVGDTLTGSVGEGRTGGVGEGSTDGTLGEGTGRLGDGTDTLGNGVGDGSKSELALIAGRASIAHAAAAPRAARRVHAGDGWMAFARTLSTEM